MNACSYPIIPHYPVRGFPRARRRGRIETKKGRKVRQCYDKDTYHRAVIRACDRAGVPRFTPYQIRHLFAIQTRDSHGLDHAQAAMGQKDPRTTQRYAKRSFRLAVEVAQADG